MIVLFTEKRKSLKILHFNGLSLTDESFQCLSIILDLEELGIYNAENLNHIGISAISRLRKLKYLKLNSAKNVTSQDFENCFANQEFCNNLVHLDLSRCLEVNDQVLEIIAKNCSEKLEFLKFDGCRKITDRGMYFILKHCRNIRTLHLRGIKQLTNLFLCQINANLPNLRFLNIRNHGPNITKSCLENVVENSEFHRFIVHETAGY